MPRILARLIERTAHKQDPWTTFYRLRPKRKSLLKPIPPRPSFNPADHARSILLSSPETNPITYSHLYKQHKSLPPRFQTSRRVKREAVEYDRPREMSDNEHQWWSSPYLRMLTSPIRKCIITGRYLPTDFLIRLAAMRVPLKLQKDPKPGAISTVLVPDGLQHSKFAARKSGRATYVLCNKDSISMLIETNTYKRIAPFLSVPSLLANQIAHLLRVRVLQEFELLADRLESIIGHSNPRSKARILRRLTRDEWNAIQTTGTIPYPNAIAVLVVPPVNKDPTTKERPMPSMAAAPLVESELRLPRKPALPLSTLHLVSPGATPLEANDIVSNHQIPLYNAVALFPARQQRSALHGLLTRLLEIDQRAGTQRPTPESPTSEIPGSASPNGKKASHAFLLCSDMETNKRGDVAAIAIALWRARMFE